MGEGGKETRNEGGKEKENGNNRTAAGRGKLAPSRLANIFLRSRRVTLFSFFLDFFSLLFFFYFVVEFVS